MIRSGTRAASTKGAAELIRRVTCGSVMSKPQVVSRGATVFDVINALTRNGWDHVFILNSEGCPMGRIHAVDALRLVARKSVNSNVAWMHATPAKELISNPPFTVRKNTPLLKAGALLLTHDMNQLAVVDDDGTLIGVVSHQTMARHLPRFIL